MEVDAEVLENIISALIPWWSAISKIFYLVGFCMIVFGVAGIARHQKLQGWQDNQKLSYLSVFCGVVLLNLPGLLDATSWTIFSESSTQTLSYSAPTSDVFGLYIQLSVYIIILVGLIATGRGVMMIRRQAYDPFVLGTAMAHIIGGVVAVNILKFAEMVGDTAGGDVEVIISNFFNI
ncbi:hypothetical protein DSCO28_73250 (plasmid) [Desulfosarcina ovata subsp. sediminis]|uniref:Uncharacterized protein n=1 Tax=Desulfosarcina ovata subsp. sediminis TaxID=885957 RepID=A0A5K8A2J6_9BACT|nr:hypothetical protein [Desulfosarcina ovata]BBO86759.1 hypothetical protein DSCO28_73250 [Desulfosarcina ovata subsp. sediminis]